MSIITKPPATPGNPTAKTTIAEDTAGNPVSKTTIAEDTAGNATVKTTVTPASAGNATSKATISENSAGNATSKTTITAASAGNATVKTTIAAAGIPRSVAPLVSMDFSAGCYAQCHTPVLFDDLFTYSRNSSATFINRRIVCGKAEFFLDTDFVGNVENLLTFSEQFDNVAWTKTDVTITQNAGIAPDGTMTADRIFPSSTGAARQLVQGNTVVAAGHNISFHIKSAGLSWVRLFAPDGAGGAFFNVKNGVIGTVVGDTVSITPEENDWYRIDVTATTSTSSTIILRLADGDNDANVTVNGSDGFLIWGAQLTESAKPLPYVKTISSSVLQAFTETLRVEYNPVNGENLGALIEGASTNLALRSEELDNASYIKTNTTITANNAVAPDGTTSADDIVESATGGGVNKKIEQAFTFTANDYSFSIFAKAGERKNIGLRMDDGSNITGTVFSMLDGSIVTNLSSAPDFENAQKLDDGWWRFTIAKSRAAAVGKFEILMADDAGSVTHTTSGGQTAKVWGVQLEQLPFASSYNRTEGGTVSRAADNLSLPSAGNFKEAEYTVEIKYDFNGISTVAAHAFSISDGTSNNRFLIKVISGSPFWLGSSGGTTDINDSGGLLSVNTEIEHVSTIKASDFIGYTNNSVDITDSASVPMVNHNVIGIGNLNSTLYLFGHIKSMSIRDVALTAQEVALL